LDRAQRKVNQVEQALRCCGNPEKLESFVDGVLELSAHQVKFFPWLQRSGDPAAFPGRKMTQRDRAAVGKHTM
jgi:hypothetical protein